MRREPEAGGDLLLILVQPLRRDEQLHAVATAVGHGERSLQPEKGLVLHAQVIGALDHHRPVDGLVAAHDALVAHDVAVGVDGRVRTVDRTLRVDQRRQQLVLDDDGGKRTAAGVGMIGGDSSHRLTHVPHDIRGEPRLIAADEAVGGLAGHVGGRDDGLDPGNPPGTRHVDAGDARVRMRRAQGGPPQEAIGGEVAREREGALHLRHTIGPRDAVAEAATDVATSCRIGHGATCERRATATRCTASMMRP